MTKEEDRFSHQRMLFRADRRDDPSAWSDTSPEGMVATAHYLATQAGADVLERGGNAVDAAIAASLALAVCEPAGSGLGGMAMMVVHLARPGRTLALMGPCRAPRRATPELVSQGKRYRGHRAVAVPSHPATVDYALRHFGTLKPGDVLAPAIRIAEEGYPVTNLQHEIAVRYRKQLAEGAGAGLFLDAGGEPLAPGTWLRQPVLARTLRRLAEAGFRDFYEGEIASRMAADMTRNGGFLAADDLTDIPWPQEKPPLRGEFDGGEVFTLGPPGGGLALIEMLNLLGALAGPGFDPDSPEGVALLAGIIRQARRDRREYAMRIGAEDLGAAGDYAGLPYAGRTAGAVRRELGLGGETSHISVMDKYGNAVAMTQSIERSFGAAAVSPELGFLYNGFLRAFNVKKPGHPHYLRPGAPARSNASPTLVLKDGRPWAALGSTGSERTASGIFEVLVRLRRQPPFEAVLAPRLHCTPESEVLLEADRFPPEAVAALARKGFTVERLEPYAFAMGGLQLVVRQEGGFRGVGEPRRDGAAAGPRKA
ncbi:MAG: gamma-glutamyltransferase [Elusimicrobiota bacterium]